jgi:hypothetical protein
VWVRDMDEPWKTDAVVVAHDRAVLDTMTIGGNTT